MAPNKISIPLRFRFPVKQIGEREIVIEATEGRDCPPLLNPEAEGYYKLSESESQNVTELVLREIAIIK